MQLKIPTTTSFWMHKAAKNKLIISQGGGRSGKTFSILMLLIATAMTLPNLVISVVAESYPFLSRGAMRDFKLIMQKAKIWNEEKWRAGDKMYVFSNNSFIEFFTADSPGKAIGAERDILFINECYNVKYEIAFQLMGRTRQKIFLDYNPVSEFWVHTEIMANPAFEGKYNYVHTTINHNEELNPNIKETMLARAQIDANYKRVYIDGEVGSLEGLVFTDWQQVDQLPDGKVKSGMDFGYTNDPTTLIKVVETPDAYYLDEMLYQTGLNNREIAGMLGSVGIKKNYDEIFADSAEPKSIDELRLAGYNVKPSVKGKDSINAGIDKLKSKKLFVTKRSVNLIKELRNYAWVTDKDGKTTNKPVDAFNHAIDAARYAVYQPQEFKPIPRKSTIYTSY